MGYRSDVVVAIQKEVYEAELLLGQGRSDWFHNAARLSNDTYYWVFNCTKWSVTYPECAYVEDLIESIVNSDNYLKCAFVRTGEDGADTDVYGNPDAFDISLVEYQSAYIEHDFDTSFNNLTIGDQNAATAA